MERGLLPENWVLYNLSEAEKAGELLFQNGFACGCNNQERRGIPQLRPMNVNHLGQIDLNSLKFIETDRDISNYILQQDDVIFNNTNSSELVGKTAVWKGKSGNYVLSNHMTIIRFLKKSHIDPSFLSRYFHHLWTKRFFKNICQDHINQSSVSLERLREIEIPLPPLPVQRRIVEILEQADALRRLRAEADAETQKLLQSVFYEMFGDPVRNEMGWDITTFGHCCKSIRYGTGMPPEYTDDGIPFIRATNVKKGTISEKNLQFVSIEDAKKIEKCRIQEGNLIVVRSGVNTGDCAYVPKKYSGSLAGFDLIVEFDSLSSAQFFNYLINSPYGIRKINLLKRRAAQEHLNAEQLKSIGVPLPPVSLQQQFARVVEDVERIRERQVESGKAIEGLCEGLMQRAFAGELVG